MTDRELVGHASPPPGPGGPRWGLGEALVGLVAGLFLSVLCASLWVGATGEDEVTLGLTAATLVGQWTGLLATLAFASRRRGTGNLAADFGLRVERSDVLPGVVAGVVSQLVIVPLLYLPLHRLGLDLDVSEKAREVTDLGKGAGIIVIALLIAVGAPLVEELFFRGLLLGALDRRFGPKWAVAGSAVTFGLVHFQPVQLLGLVAFGVVLAVLAQRAGRLGPSLVAHMTFNATTVVLLVASR